MPFTPEQSTMLAKPLDPKHVVKPTGRFGAKGDYIEGWHAIAEANRIFGHDGWSYTIQLIQDHLNHGEDSEGRPQWQAAYSCLCTVEAGGVTRQDVGFGSGFAKQIGDAIEGATKEAATDALKRALRTFGHPFGLALYDKTRANVATPEVELSRAAMDAIAEIDTLDTQAQLKAVWERFSSLPDSPDRTAVAIAVDARLATLKSKRKAA